MLVQGLLPLFAFAGAVLGQNTIIDKFDNPTSNALGNYHGCDDVPGAISCEYGPGGLTVISSDTDYSFYTQFGGGCADISDMNNKYLHVKLSGSQQFSIALQQNNPGCNPDAAPYPETWDIVNAADYSNGADIYVPINHFNIIKTRAIGFAFKAFRDPGASTTFTLAEIVPSVPSGFNVPQKKPTGPLYFACTRPNSIAFGIDDGVPGLAQRMMQIIKDENIKVTFFTVGNALDDPNQPYASLYREAAANGHQIALHTYTHPKVEGLNDVGAIDSEILGSRDATLRNIGVSSKYFRAPYGTDGALTRQRLEANIPGSKVINWSIDIEDWKWGESDTSNQQTAAVRRDIDKGGNLFVAHYLYDSTVDQFAEFIKIAKATGKQIMRIDQCLEDPSAPPL